LDQSEEAEGARINTRHRWYVLMNLKLNVAILLIAAVPVYAQAQNPTAARVSKGDAQKVATIISGDQAKTKAYCDMQKLAEQLEQAHEKKDSKRVNELSQKIETLEKTLGPQYIALIDGLQDIAENDQLGAEFLSAFGLAVYEVGLDPEGACRNSGYRGNAF
jgi:flagellar motility protein MotE (MotC chaperone)